MYRGGGGRRGRGGGRGRNRGRGGGGGVGRGGDGRGGSICFTWRDTGFCRLGSSCKFRHDGPGGSGNGDPTGSGQQVSPQRIVRTSNDLVNFIKHLAVLPHKKIGTELVNSSSLWSRCWTQHQFLDSPSRRRMIEILTKIPGSSSVDPPPIDPCQEVVRLFLADQIRGATSDDLVLTAVKTVSNAMDRLLLFEWNVSGEVVKNAFSGIILLAEGKLRKAKKEHREVATSLMHALEEMEKPWRIKLKDVSLVSETGDKSETEPLTYEGWQSATVEWLRNPAFFSPACCPVMKVGSSGVYKNAEDYMETVHRLWVAMTFSDGFAALAPHCRSRGQSGSCQNTLWPVTAENSYTARLNCRNPVAFTCRIKSHDSMCERCAEHSITCHLGAPGPGAATHIYDAKVKRVTADGLLYISDFKSRNPPPNVHWRTTKRLSPPNLVGIVLLGARGVPLATTDAIKWGEIVYHGHSGDEDRKRQSGQLAVNLSSVTEFESEHFSDGAFVAVIDCMTFVPEWVPVLRALESQKHRCLPFENGKYLNLWKTDPVDTSNSVLDASTPDSVFVSDRSELIEKMVDESELEPIREIRRDDTLKRDLMAQLESLVVETTLDKMQLISFIDSLRNPVHLTQGPPGTGKSYLGVVLVRALLIIRRLWLKKSGTVGTPPILVLSYKNHAIDEFLFDLVKTEPVSSLRNKLIRIGGQCKDPRLVQFSEQNAFLSDTEVKACHKEVERLDHLRESIQATVDGDVSSFLSYRHLMFAEYDDSSEHDEKSRRKAAIDATTVLMHSIGRREMLMDAIAQLEGVECCKPRDVATKLSFLELGSNREPSRVLEQRVNGSNGSLFIPELQKGVRHYPPLHWGDVIHRWICGKVPLPVCQFIADGSACNQLSMSPMHPLCDKHQCHFLTTEQDRCSMPCKAGDAPLCLHHCCEADDCVACKLPNGQKFCKVHACKKCASLGLSGLATDDPPRNVCEQHPMCIIPVCSGFCAGNGIYCDDHKLVSNCSAWLAKKGRRCRATAVSRYTPFCQNHLHLRQSVANEEEEDDYEATSSVDKVKCIARTKEGSKCKATAQLGSAYCYDHSLPSTSTVTAVVGYTANEEADSTLVVCEMSRENDTFAEINEDVTASVEGTTGAPTSRQLLKETPSEMKLIGDEISSESSLTLNAEVVVSGLRDDIEVDELDLEDEGENLKHLREVFEVNDHESDSENGIDDCEDATNAVATNGTSVANTEEAITIYPSEWAWDMPLDVRWSACQMMMKELQELMNTVTFQDRNLKG